MPVKMLTPFLAAAALVAAGCGDDEKSTESGSGGDSQAELVKARAELAETKVNLEAAQNAYETGDKAAAEELASEAYVSHFELVEPALEERDHELTEELEEEIREKLRADIESGEKAAVLARFDEIFEHIEAAEAALR